LLASLFIVIANILVDLGYASGVTHVEFPTVRSYTLGPPGDPGVVRHSRTTPLPDPSNYRFPPGL